MHAQWSGVPYRWMQLVLGEDNEVAHGIPGSETDQHSAPYAMTEEFTAVYRMHPLLPDTVRIHSLDERKTNRKLSISSRCRARRHVR